MNQIIKKRIAEERSGSEHCHPIKKYPLIRGVGAHLYDREGNLEICSNEGSFDFVVDAASQKERAHYDSEYADGGWTTKDSLDSIDYHSLWTLDVSSSEYLNSLGNLSEKKVLLLGNGTSVKEFLFVKRGANVTFTDLSFEAVKYAKRRYQASSLGTQHPNDCHFHAVNAYHLPFPKNTFDVICADAVVHHMDDLHTLFSEIYRCLKPGGFCRFADGAYSPLWQEAKKGILRGMQKRSHKKHGISPEDRKATERGGYTRFELDQLRAKLGFSNLYYKRVALLDYLLWRARCKFEAKWLLTIRPGVRWLDRMLAKTPIMEKQGIALVFGFGK